MKSKFKVLILAWMTVTVSCSMDRVMILVSPCGHNSDLYIFADELHLGSGCPVTQIQPSAYDFIYPVHDRGIRTKFCGTEMLYPKGTPHKLRDQVEWKSVWLTPVSADNEIKLDPSPFIADFETTPEELGLLSSSQTGSLLKEKWRLGVGIMNFVRKTVFLY